jgi:hypothetical protein
MSRGSNKRDVISVQSATLRSLRKRAASKDGDELPDLLTLERSTTESLPGDPARRIHGGGDV